VVLVDDEEDRFFGLVAYAAEVQRAVGDELQVGALAAVRHWTKAPVLVYVVAAGVRAARRRALRGS
jgi:hypothetical protein